MLIAELSGPSCTPASESRSLEFPPSTNCPFRFGLLIQISLGKAKSKTNEITLIRHRDSLSANLQYDH